MKARGSCTSLAALIAIEKVGAVHVVKLHEKCRYAACTLWIHAVVLHRPQWLQVVNAMRTLHVAIMPLTGLVMRKRNYI